MATYMVFDVESIGLHGEGFAVGYVVVNEQGQELEASCLACPPETAHGIAAGREWVDRNCPPLLYECSYPAIVRAFFWETWQRWRLQGAVLVADCAWPVEARFLAACVDDDPTLRATRGPYPLHEAATARLAAGFAPLATAERLPNELPAHDPLADARQSARLWIEALSVLSQRQNGEASHA